MIVLKIISVVCWGIMFLGYGYGFAEPTKFMSAMMSATLLFGAIVELLK